MIRKSLFWGLTVVLAAVLVALIIRAQKEEKLQATRAEQILRQQSGTTSTRVLKPEDLQVIDPTMQIDSQSKIRIRNIGTVAYRGIGLRLVYLDVGGKELLTRTHVVSETVSPGSSIEAFDARPKDVPDPATQVQVSILYADIVQKISY